MTEIQFRDQLAYVISRIDCGHTSMKGSKAFSKYVDTASSLAFPFALKFWSDTMVITANLRRNDPILQRGTVVLSINGYNAQALTDTLFNYITTDGYSMNGKYQSLSTGFAFRQSVQKYYRINRFYRHPLYRQPGNGKPNLCKTL